MRSLLAKDLRADADERALVLEFLYDNGGSVGDLLVERAEYLLADDLSGDLSLGLVGDHILGEEPIRLREELGAFVHQLGHVLALLCGYRNERDEVVLLGILADRLGKHFAVVHIDLVERENCGNSALFEVGNYVFLYRCDLFAGVDDENYRVGVAHRGVSRLDHKLAEAVLRGVHAGGVEENELIVALCEDTGNAVSRGLGLV